MNKHRDSNIATLEPAGFRAARDRVFADRNPLGDFSFNPQVAQVFDDMVSRSVPFYGEMQRMTTEVAAQFAQDGTNIYDLGCATATTLAMLDPLISSKVRFVGIDNAQSMLDQARAKLDALDSKRAFDLVCADLHDRPRNGSDSEVPKKEILKFSAAGCIIFYTQSGPEIGAVQFAVVSE